MFDSARAYQKEQRLKKKADNTLSEKRVENLMRLELREKLTKYLLSNDSMMIEIDPKHVSMFLAIVEEEFSADYDYEQVSETLYIFRAKEIDWT